MASVVRCTETPVPLAQVVAMSLCDSIHPRNWQLQMSCAEHGARGGAELNKRRCRSRNWQGSYIDDFIQIECLEGGKAPHNA